MTRKQKEDLINNLNPEWKELVTDKEFVRDKTPWSEKVKEIMDEIMKDI